MYKRQTIESPILSENENTSSISIAETELEENKIEFNVVRKATKPQIRTAIEDLFKIKVSGVNTRIAKEGKIAIVKLSPEDSAEDLSNRLGIL